MYGISPNISQEVHKYVYKHASIVWHETKEESHVAYLG